MQRTLSITTAKPPPRVRRRPSPTLLPHHPPTDPPHSSLPPCLSAPILPSPPPLASHLLAELRAPPTSSRIFSPAVVPGSGFGLRLSTRRRRLIAKGVSLRLSCSGSGEIRRERSDPVAWFEQQCVGVSICIRSSGDSCDGDGVLCGGSGLLLSSRSGRTVGDLPHQAA